MRRARLVDQINQKSNLVNNFAWMNGSALGIRYLGVRFLPAAFGAVFASERVVLPVRPKLSLAVAIATGKPEPQSSCGLCHHFCGRQTSSLCQAAGLKRVIIDSGADFFALDSPTLSQTSRNAFARSSTSRSLWKGVGVMRSRSVPRGTVG